MIDRSAFNGQTFRFVTVVAVVLAMLIPLALIGGLTSERQAYFDQVFDDIADSWGGAQVFAGPFLLVPEIHEYSTQNDEGVTSVREIRRHRVVLPEAVATDLAVDHQFRQRAIYEVPVYVARLDARGTFELPPPPDGVRQLLEEAKILVGISHTQAINTMSKLEFGDVAVPFRASTGEAWLGSGVHADVGEAVMPPAEEPQPIAFNFSLELKGTRSFGFAPLGGQTDFSMGSTWPHPSFGGRYLPDEYEIDATGFNASWAIHELARNLPSTWLTDAREPQLAANTAAVELFQPITSYTVVDRGIKYGILFVGLTFLTFICFEMLTVIRFHTIQYGVVGIGLVLFYLALLSLSEHIHFDYAYLIATTVLSLLIGWYVWMMTHLPKLTTWALGVLVALYGCLYVLLKLEDFAVLVGTAILLVGLFALMYATKSLTETVSEESG